MAQKEVRPIPIARTKSLKVADERKQEELARDVIRRFLLPPSAGSDATSKDEVSADVPIIPSLDGELVVESESNPPAVCQSSPSLPNTSTPCTTAKPKRLAFAPRASLSPIQSPSVEPSHNQEEGSALDVTESLATFTRDTPFRHSAVVLPSSSSAQRLADEGHRAVPTSQSEAPRMRSSSCVYLSAGARIPPDQRELVPMQIADMLRDIADNQVEPALRQQGLFDQLTSGRSDIQVLNNRDALHQQLERLIPDGRFRDQNGRTLECAVVYWARGLIWAKAILQGLEATHPSQMGQLQQLLEDALVEVFRKNQLMWWLNTPLSIFAACKNRVEAVVASCRGHLATWSPRLLGRRRMSSVTTQPASDGALEQTEESGFFEHSSSVPSSPISTPTAAQRRTSSISDLVTSPLMVASASVVGTAATYIYKNT